METTKKQAQLKTQPLINEIEEIKKDLQKVTHLSTIAVIKQLLEDKEKLLAMYQSHANS